MSREENYCGYKISSSPRKLESGKFSPNGYIESDEKKITMRNLIPENIKECQSETEADDLWINSAKKHIDDHL